MPKKVTVQEASPSPSPSAAVLDSEGGPVDVPINSLGDDSDEEDGDNTTLKAGKDASEDEEDTWNPSEEKLPGQDDKLVSKGKEKGKGKAVATDEDKEGEKPHPWQAVWSEEKNGEL